MIRLRLTAPEVVPRDQPNSCLERLEQRTGRGPEPGSRHEGRHRRRGDPPGAHAGAYVLLDGSAHPPSLGTEPARRACACCRTASRSCHLPLPVR